jgi:hypothetical protein
LATGAPLSSSSKNRFWVRGKWASGSLPGGDETSFASRIFSISWC